MPPNNFIKKAELEWQVPFCNTQILVALRTLSKKELSVNEDQQCISSVGEVKPERWWRSLWSCKSWVVLKSSQYNLLAETVNSIEIICNLFLYSCLPLGKLSVPKWWEELLNNIEKISEHLKISEAKNKR